MTPNLEDYEPTSKDLFTRLEKLRLENDSLLALNEKLRSKIKEISQANNNNIFLSSAKGEFESVNDDILSTNQRFATINKQLILFNEQISRKKQPQQQQQQQHRIIAHELRTLTHAILWYSEMLQIDYEQDSNNSDEGSENIRSKKRILHVIARSANELQKLINEILDDASTTQTSTNAKVSVNSC